MKILRIIALIGFVGFSSLKSQDIHFSQFSGSILNLNPALTGFFNGDYRVNAIYRTQWSAVPVPYSTISFGGDHRFRPSSKNKNSVGVGLFLNNDRAGDARYGITQFYASGSYIYSAKEDSSLLISGGMNFGINQVGFDYNKMTFDSQFDGLTYNSSDPTGENFDFTSYTYVDLNMGFAAQYLLNRKQKFIFATSLNHLTTPKISYQSNNLSKLDFRTGLYGYFSTPISNDLDLITELNYNRQGKYDELLPHASLKYYLKKDANQAVLGGLSLRAKDAFILRGGYTYRDLQAGIAYDINTSKFTAATNRRGGFEIYVIYIMFKKYQTVIKKKPCPVFM